jgi:hypothetical protein
MPEPISTLLFTSVSSVWGYIKWPVTQIVSALRLNAKVAELEEKVGKLSEQSAAPSPFRKCPHCSERDMRLQDQYRYRNDVFDNQRYLHEKWRCFTCGAIDEVNIPEPGG